MSIPIALAIAAATAAMIVTPAASQANPPANATPPFNSTAPRTTTTAPAIANPNDTNKTTAAPVPGANSFTKGQVETRLNDNGYSSVSGLMKDDQSVWRAKAMKSGKKVDVTVDYQGNITAQ